MSARNEKYAALKQLQAGGGDNFSGRHTQTLNNAQKNKEVFATPPPTRDAGVTAAAWDIFGVLACCGGLRCHGQGLSLADDCLLLVLA